MSSSFGTIFRVTTFGESHGSAVGAVIDGIPARISLDVQDIQQELDRRKPSGHIHSTSRKEEDQAEILSGVFEGRTIGSPLCVVVKNKDHRSADYAKIQNLYRPGHADKTYTQKYGFRDYRGGGRSSGRETIGRVIGGAVAKKALEDAGITFLTFLTKIGTMEAKEFQLPPKNPYLFADPAMLPALEDLFQTLKKEGDSVGAVVETRIKGLPAGIGEPVFDKLPALLGQGILSIGSVKGIEFGAGFRASEIFGSQMNDQPGSATNYAGGVLGGISNGDEVVFRTVIKPASSIRQAQAMESSSGGVENIALEGRFDICIGPRAAIVVESMAAIVVMDLFLRAKLSNWLNVK